MTKFRDKIELEFGICFLEFFTCGITIALPIFIRSIVFLIRNKLNHSFSIE